VKNQEAVCEKRRNDVRAGEGERNRNTFLMNGTCCENGWGSVQKTMKKIGFPLYLFLRNSQRFLELHDGFV